MCVLCAKTLEQSVVEHLEEIVVGVLLALFDTDETQCSYAEFITYVMDFTIIAGRLLYFINIFRIDINCYFIYCF